MVAINLVTNAKVGGNGLEICFLACSLLNSCYKVQSLGFLFFGFFPPENNLQTPMRGQVNRSNLSLCGRIVELESY